MKPSKNQKYEVVEGIHGTWFYHIAPKGKTQRALCGKATMFSYMNFSNWGYSGHLNERYCRECYNLAFPAKYYTND